jgi:hypothetical protein
MPPSVNESLASVRGRFIKTNVARVFERRVLHYFNTLAEQQKRAVGDFKNALFKQRPKDRKILFEAKFYFQESDLYRQTKGKDAEKGEPKRKDTSNRIKPLEDRISENINIDDKYFFFVWVSKHHIDSDQSLIAFPDGYCSVRLSIIPTTE